MEATGVKKDLVDRLGLQGPLIQAPMAGGATTPELVAAVSNAGALGSLGGNYLPPAELEKALRQIKLLTRRPFAVNLFARPPQPLPSDDRIEAALRATQIYRRELGLPEPALRPPFMPDFEQQFAVILSEQPAVFSFTFGLLDEGLLQECRRRGILTVGTATTPDEGVALEKIGVDAVVAQGAEAGAHRGTFSPDQEDLLIGVAALVPILAGAIDIPVIAAGGIMNGRGIAAAVTLGAEAAQLGTAFLACEESGISKPYRNALLDPKRKATRLTRAFSGRWARGLENRFMLEMASKENAILPFPAQNEFTQDIRKKAAQLELPDYLSLWAGQGVGLIRCMKAGALVATLYEETSEAIAAANRYSR